MHSATLLRNGIKRVILLICPHPSGPQNIDLETPAATAGTCARCAAAAAMARARRYVCTDPANELLEARAATASDVTSLYKVGVGAAGRQHVGAHAQQKAADTGVVGLAGAEGEKWKL